MLKQVVGATLPIGDHWWTAGPSGIWQVHLDTILMTLIAAAMLLALGLAVKSHITSGKPGNSERRRSGN